MVPALPALEEAFMRSLSRLVLPLLFAILTGVLVFHFAMTLTYLTPLNPLKLRFHHLILGYMHPFFIQSWQLFAPEPVKDTRVLVVACRRRQPDGTLTETAWADISAPFRQARARNRFSPADRLDRPQSSAVHAIFNRSEILTTLEERRSEGDTEYNKIVDQLKEAERRQREAGYMVLNRIGSAHCDRLYGRGQTAEVRIRIAVLRFPRFSERYRPDSEGKLSYVALDWAPYQPVAPLAAMEVRR
jgi:Family of unknown function (DUF5819)